MKATKLTSLLVIALALTIVGTGCRKKPAGVTPLKNRDQIVRPGEMTGLTPYTGDEGLGGTNLGTPMNPAEWMKDPNAHTANAEILKPYVVHFDYDSSVVKSSEQANVDAVASYMKSNSGIGLRIDGHCDERGTEGYNDSLGERRAAALREALIALGVNADSVITQSLGERAPVATGQDESAYAQNRRGEFIVLTPK